MLFNCFDLIEDFDDEVVLFMGLVFGFEGDFLF